MGAVAVHVVVGAREGVFREGTAVSDALTSAIKLVDEALDMPPSQAVQHLFDRYRVALPESKEAIVLALIGALNVARRGSGRAAR